MVKTSHDPSSPLALGWGTGRVARPFRGGVAGRYAIAWQRGFRWNVIAACRGMVAERGIRDEPMAKNGACAQLMRNEG